MKLLHLLAALCCGVCCLGCLDASVGPLPPTPSPTPQPPAPNPFNPGHTDTEFWKALADRVAAGRVPSTDRLILILKEAQETGDLRAAERIADVLPDIAANPETITETNRDHIATALRKLSR